MVSDDTQVTDEGCEICEDADAVLVYNKQFMCAECAEETMLSEEDDEEEY